MIDWVKVSEQALAGGITLLVGFALLWLGKWVDRQRALPKERVLLELGELRGKGVDLRNWGEARVLKGAQLGNWLAKARQVEDEIIAKAGELSKFEGQRLMWLDRVRAYPRYPESMSNEQKQMLWNLGGLFERCDALMAKYRF
jgi:hypothetical protein